MAERATHYLRRSKHAGYPKRQAVVACRFARLPLASTPGIATDVLLAWRACAWRGPPGEEVWESDGDGVTPETFWRWIRGGLKRREQAWLWTFRACHRLGLLGFWDRLDAGEWVLSRKDCSRETNANDGSPKGGNGIVVLSDPPTIIVAMPSHGSGSIRILDIRNLGVRSESDMGADSDCPRQQAVWLQDWAATVETLNLGGLRCTAAAQAYHGWRYSYLNCGVMVDGDGEATRHERRSVYPGRAEAFRIGNVPGNGFALDASAFYPSCSVAGEVPCRSKWRGICTGGQLRTAIDKGWLAIVTCQVRCREPILPCRIDGKGRPVGEDDERGMQSARRGAQERTVWPVGTWTGTLCGPEYQLAEASGSLVRVMQASLFEPDRPFDDFVSRLWQARVAAKSSGHTGGESCIKLLMNSLTGKLAAHEYSWVDEPMSCPPGPWQTWQRYGSDGLLVGSYRTIGWHAQRLVRGEETAESTPAIAAWIYSLGRVQLWKWMEDAGMENVHYVDSDSVITNEQGLRSLDGLGHIRPGVMGALRLQSVYEGLRIAGIKGYAHGRGRCIAGIDPSLTDDGAGHYSGWRSESVGEAMARGNTPTSRARFVQLPVARAYRHGHVGRDGRVSPLEVSE